MKLGFRFAFHLECVGGKESSFTLNGNAGKMEILEEKKNQDGNSFSCLFNWKDGLSLK